jgi:hypothetical protein
METDHVFIQGTAEKELDVMKRVLQVGAAGGAGRGGECVRGWGACCGGWGWGWAAREGELGCDAAGGAACWELAGPWACAAQGAAALPCPGFGQRRRRCAAPHPVC